MSEEDKRPKRTPKDIERLGIKNLLPRPRAPREDPDVTVIERERSEEIQRTEMSSSASVKSNSSRLSRSIFSTASHRSSTYTLKKDEVTVLAQAELNQLEETEEGLRRRSDQMQFDIKLTMDEIEANQQILDSNSPEGAELAELQDKIRTLKAKLRNETTEYEKFQIDFNFDLSSINRKKSFIKQKAKFDEDKINHEEVEDELKSQDSNQERLERDKIILADESSSSKVDGWECFKSMEPITVAHSEQENQLQTARQELEQALQRQNNVKKLEAETKAIKAKEDLAKFEADEARKQQDFERAQQANIAKRLKLQREAQAAEDLLKSSGSQRPSIPQITSTLTAPSNPTEAMMCRYFEMKLNMMDQGQGNQRQQTSTFLARQSHAKELPYFGGKPEEWPTFIAEYERSSKDCAFSNSENMSRLRKCLKGEAIKTVQCLMVSPDNLNKVLKTLKERFGQPEHIIEAMIGRARDVPCIKPDKLDTLIEFGNAVQNVTMSITALKCDEHLNNPHLLRELEGKLPVQLQMNWMRWTLADNTRKKNLSFFSEWLEQETAIACRLCPPKVESESKRKAESPRRRKHGETVLATSTANEESKNRNENSKKQGNSSKWKSKETKCVLCSNIGHRIAECQKFEKINLNDRWKAVKDNKLCFNCLIFGHDWKTCRKSKECGIDSCERSHHRLLHPPSQVNATRESQSTSTPPPDPSVVANAQIAHAGGLEARVNVQILPVRVQGPKGIINTFAMLDSGANITLIEADLADELGLKGPRKPLRFQGLHPIAEELDSRSVKLNIMPAVGDEVFGMVNVRTVKNMPLPYQTIKRKLIEKWQHLKGLGISTYENAQPKLLIGNDHIKLMVTREIREGPSNAPVAIKTNLGWTLLNTGDVPDKPHCTFFCQEKDDLHQLVKKYFTTEQFGVKVIKEMPRSKDDKRAQQIMDSTMRRVGVDGKRFETGLLWKADDVQLPESKSMTLNRLKSIERKIDKEPKFAVQYLAKMQHYFDMGYARKLTEEESQVQGPRTWYLPHFGTSKPSKPDKIRLVFDAAAKSHGVCLNDTLLKGADQVNPLPSVLFKFREREIGITGDIREMFHQVNIREEDRSSLRFLWRGMDRNIEPETYEMQVMVFGAACSPVCAQEAKNKNAMENLEKYPKAANAIIYKHFVDDYLDSFDTEEEASKQINEVIGIHKEGGFEIVNFISSSSKVLQQLPVKIRAAEPKKIDPESTNMERVLGLNWDPEKDEFTFSTSFHRVPKEVISGQKIPTKREALSLLMSMYDPLGFLAHFRIKAQIHLQETWRSEIGWDDELPSNTHEKWLKWIEELQRIPTFRLPRCYHPEFSKSTAVQLHVFCDASQQAFAAVAYFRITTDKGIKVAFASAKARVAPLKTLCMPRMELQAAVLGVRLAISIKQQHEVQPVETHYWTDSEVAYCWVRSDGNRCPQFVSHRIGEIQESSDAKEWHWVPTKENVADEATRDNKPTQWDPKSRWLNGPDFLLLPDSEWPQKSTKEIRKAVNDEELEFKNQFVGTTIKIENPFDVTRISSWRKLRRVAGWLLRFLQIHKTPKSERRMYNRLLVAELKKADIWLYNLSQDESFREEKARVAEKLKIQNSSRLKSGLDLEFTLDKDGVMRLEGRLDQAENVPYDVRKPIVLDSKHHITKLIIQYYHEEAGHHGRERVVNELRQLYHIVNLRTAVKSAWNNCQQCKNARALPVIPRMGLLPECRLQSYVRPFTVTGLDYFGPMEVTVGRRHEKRYGALFTCLTSRAVHVEIAHSLTTDSCIMAIRRFASRRGNPSKIYSDNGTNFHGANNELQSALKELNQEVMEDKMSNLGIEWHFIPPAAPHMGGSWESLVKSVKTALYATLKERHPKEELLHTLMTEAEHVVNARPLTHVSYDPDDMEALTPNHFLIGATSNLQPPGNFHEKEICLRSQWRAAEALCNQFWRRWVREYLPTLAKRTKWHKMTKPVEIGDVVIIADNNMTRSTWPKGIVVAVFPGRDGVVRVVELRTANGSIFKRPVSKICVLEVKKMDENA